MITEARQAHGMTKKENRKRKKERLLNLKLTIMLIRAIAEQRRLKNVQDQPSGMEFSNALKTKDRRFKDVVVIKTNRS